MELSIDQKQVLDKILEWYKDKDKNQYITIGGYAGTGKTTLIAKLSQQLKKDNKKLKIAFCSFTGKATRVLKTKLAESNSITDKDTISTIHGLIYSPIVNGKEEIVGWKMKDELETDLIIVDEASMIDMSIWADLKSFKKPIIAVGDHGQLPPINGNFNLMEKPELKLEVIHRQQRENPIIKLSIMTRERGVIPAINYSKGVKKIRRNSSEANEVIEEWLGDYDPNTLILCGFNYTRVKLNKYIRSMLGFETTEPQVGDRVICLRNNHTAEIFNGMLGTIISIKDESKNWYEAEIEMDGEKINYFGLIAKKQFGNSESLNFTEKRSEIMDGDLFDFGYALTVHKAQGSQAKKVILFEERFSKMDDEMWRRWLYTAVTRAEEELYIVG